ncbi:MAG: glycosyltransferase family 4 protein [Burkholderiaceae bacterium]
MLSPSPKLTGGVIDFVEMVRANFSSHVFCTTQVGNDGSKLPLAVRLARDGWSFVRSILRMHPEVVHLNPSLDRSIVREGFYLLLARIVYRGPIVVFVHGWEEVWAARISGSPLPRSLFRAVFRRADRIYVLATSFRDQLVALGIDQTRVRVTSTMVDMNQFRGLVRSRPVDDGSLRLLFMSRLVPRKGAIETVRAFALLADAFPSLRLCCAGDGPERSSLQHWVSERGLADRVSFPGFVRGQAKAQLMLDSDVFVFPTSYGEGCPVTLLEAMAAGLPVVTAEAGGIPDVAQDGVHGRVLAKQPGAQAVADAIGQLLADPAALRRVGQANAIEAARRFDSVHWCRALEGDYAQLLQ